MDVGGRHLEQLGHVDLDLGRDEPEGLLGHPEHGQQRRLPLRVERLERAAPRRPGPPRTGPAPRRPCVGVGAHRSSSPPIMLTEPKVGHDVGDHTALEHAVERRHRREARRPAAHPVGPVGAVGHDVEAELAVGPLDGEVHLAPGRPDPEAVHDQHEVVHQALDRAVRRLLRRQHGALVGGVDRHVVPPLLARQVRGEPDVGDQEALGLAELAPVDVLGGHGEGPPFVVHVDRAAGQLRERLLGDPHRLLHLGHADEVAVVVVAGLADRDLEVEPVVHPVGGRPPDVERHARGAEEGPGDRVGDRLVPREDADALHPVDEDPVGASGACATPRGRSASRRRPGASAPRSRAGGPP